VILLLSKIRKGILIENQSEFLCLYLLRFIIFQPQNFNKMKSMKRLSGIYLLFAAFLFTGCPNEEEDTPLDVPEPWPEGMNVYVSGFEDVQQNPIARLWKTVKRKTLPAFPVAQFV
jgi:hypothetical protein